MKIICIGRNYRAHAAELRNEVPESPVIFMKPSTALIGDAQHIMYPAITKDLHYECELVVKISKTGKNISEEEAASFYNELSLGIDFTARDLQEQQKKKGLPWEVAKSFDGAAVVGGFISKDALANVMNLKFQFYKNDALVQDGHTADMIFSVDYLIHYASVFFTLEEGDLLFTGTPAGVGAVLSGDVLHGVLEGQEILKITID